MRLVQILSVDGREDASLDEELGVESFGVLCRHVLWVLPDTTAVLQQWTALLRATGRLMLVEGRWSAGGGLTAAEVVAALPSTMTGVTVENLSDVSSYWGRAVDDERYAVTARLAAG